VTTITFSKLSVDRPHSDNAISQDLEMGVQISSVNRSGPPIDGANNECSISQTGIGGRVMYFREVEVSV